MIRINSAFIVDYLPCHELWCNEMFAKAPAAANLNPQEQDFYDFIKSNFTRIIKMNKNDMLDFMSEINRNYPIVYEAIKKIEAVDSLGGKYNTAYKNTKHNDINVILATVNCPAVVFDTIEKMKDLAIETIKSNFNREKVFKSIKLLFDYDKFRDERGAEYIDKSQIETCPYCNRAFIASYNNVSYTADIDHYFPRSKYPFFGVTLYNLIPSCTFCNERLKLAKDFLENEHLYPYGDDLEDRVFFEITEVKDPYIKTKDSFDIRINPITNTDNPAQASIDTFQLQELYQSHKQMVVRLAKIKRINTEEMRKEIKKLCRLDSEKEICDYYTDLKFFAGENGILSKFIKDISNDIDEKFGLGVIK